MTAYQAPPSQARTLEWVAIFFLQWKKVKSEKWSRSVMSDSSWPHGLQPTRLLHPWDFPGKSTGVGCHHLLRKSWLPGFIKHMIVHGPWQVYINVWYMKQKQFSKQRGKQESSIFGEAYGSVTCKLLCHFFFHLTYFVYYTVSQWHPTPVLLTGKSHGRRSLVGCSPGDREESDMTERLHFHFSLSCIGEGNGNPLQCSCLENPRDRGACWAAVYGVAQSQTRLTWLSSSI